jgi:hypothetical protein
LFHVGLLGEAVIYSYLDKEAIKGTRKPITWQVVVVTGFCNT